MTIQNEVQRPEVNMQVARLLRPILKAMMAIGVALIPIGPIARMNNEGFGDPPGPIQVSDYWERVSYVLMPIGGGIAFFAAVLLMIIDRKQSKVRSSLDCERAIESQNNSVNRSGESGGI